MFDDLPENSDTASPEMLNKYYELIRNLTPEARLMKCLQLSKRVRQFVEAGVLSRYPNATKEENKKRLAAHYLGEELAVKYFGWLPTDGK